MTDQPTGDYPAHETLEAAATEMRLGGVVWEQTLADLLHSEAVWAKDVGSRYPDDKAPLLAVAEAYLEGIEQ